MQCLNRLLWTICKGIPAAHKNLQNKQECKMRRKSKEKTETGELPEGGWRLTERGWARLFEWDEEAPREWPQGETEHQREGEMRRGREAKLMQFLSRTNVFRAAEYRSHIFSDCLPPLYWTRFLQQLYTLHQVLYTTCIKTDSFLFSNLEITAQKACLDNCKHFYFCFLSNMLAFYSQIIIYIFLQSDLLS